MSDGEIVEVVQEVEAVPVLAPEPRGRGLIGSVAPATQAVAVAAGGFVAGAAVVSLAAHRRGKGSRALARGRRGRRGARRTRRNKAGELVRIVGTRSLLVDVHLLDGGR